MSEVPHVTEHVPRTHQFAILRGEGPSQLIDLWFIQVRARAILGFFGGGGWRALWCYTGVPVSDTEFR